MVAADLTVACVLWVGDFRKRNYTPEWVRKLRNMVARNLFVPHRFVCLSNVEIDDVERLPFKHDWPGWFSKIELFRPGNGLEGRVLYLDLDVLITGNLQPIAEHPGPMAMMPPSHVFMRGSPIDRPDVVNRYQTSCMVWDTPAGREIYEKFTPEMMERFRGDQDVIGHIKQDCSVMNPNWFRKLKQCQAGPKDHVKVVLSMPWKNDVAARKFPWVSRVWT